MNFLLMMSIQYKVDYIFERDFGGAMIWELSSDTTDYELGSIVADVLYERGSISSEGIEYRFIRDLHCERDLLDPDIVIGRHYIFNADITGFNGSQRDVLITRWVTSGNDTYTVRRINSSAFANKGLLSVEFESTYITSIGVGAFAGNPLRSVMVPERYTNTLFNSIRNGMQGVTTRTILLEGTTPIYRWNKIDNWVPID